MIRLVVVDIDGTLTRWRGDLLLSIEAIEAVRMLEDRGIRVSLSSGNSLPVTAGVARYIGARGPVIGENGCLILYRQRLIHVCRGRPGEDLISKLTSIGLRESWQNTFRFHDLSFNAPQGREDLLVEGARIAREMGYEAFLSGYALHIQPAGGGKGAGLLKTVQLLGLDPREVLAVGDGENDIPMLVTAGYSAAPSDADDRVKRVPGGRRTMNGGKGFREVVEELILRQTT